MDTSPGIALRVQHPLSLSLHPAARVIIGDYVEHSRHLDHPVFSRRHSVGEAQTDVLVYYWNDADGAEHQGWWFGPHIGSVSVWAYCPGVAALPPESGWHIPFDAPDVSSLVVQLVGSS